jgi:23S rRNA G2445 N2-methylase RlmL
MMETLILSPLGHTWILDLDGTLVKHNGYKLDGRDAWLDGALEFLRGIPEGDMIVFITSRAPEFKAATELFLAEHGVRYDHMIYNAPFGERILVNDQKPSGLKTAIAVNAKRNELNTIRIEVDESL